MLVDRYHLDALTGRFEDGQALTAGHKRMVIVAALPGRQ
jgi:hypothetical protein